MSGSPFRMATVKRFLLDAKPKQQKFDSALPGFGVRANGKGSGSWVFVYVSPDTKKQRRYTIAPIFVMSLSGARAQAWRLKAMVYNGTDPAEQTRG